MEQTEPEPISPRQLDWLERLEREHPNLRAGLEWSLAAADGAFAGLRLAGALGWFWFQRGYVSEGRQWLQHVLATAPEEPTGREGAQMHPASGSRGALATTIPRAKALLAAGWLGWLYGEYDRSLALREECLALCREREDEWGVAAALQGSGDAYLRQGDLGRSVAPLEESVARFRELGSRWHIAWTLASLEIVPKAQGEHERSIALSEEALRLFRSVGDTWGTGLMLNEVASNLTWQGRYEHAARLAEEGLALRRQVGDKFGIHQSLLVLFRIARGRQDYTRAAAFLEDNLAAVRELGPRPARHGSSLTSGIKRAATSGLPGSGGRLNRCSTAWARQSGPPTAARMTATWPPPEGDWARRRSRQR